MLLCTMNSSILNRATKFKICHSIIRTKVTYDCETGYLRLETQKMKMLETKILRKIFGPVQHDGKYRIRRNQELENLIEGANMARFIKSQRM